MKEYEFDFEKLKVYQKSLEMIDLMFATLRHLPKEYRYPIGDNLIRAALSVANNIAEGNDRVSSKDRVRFLRIASGSARECVSVIIVLRRQKLMEEPDFFRFKDLLREITSMLHSLIASLNE